MNFEPDRPATMKDVAARVGVTVATVSLALNRSPQIPEKTRNRICKIAAELGYQKSPYIAAHMASRRKGRAPASSPVLAFVTAAARIASGSSREMEIAQAYFEGASARAAARGYRIESFSLADPTASAQRLGRILHARSVAGVLVAPLPEGWKSLSFEWARFPAVALGHTLVEPLIHHVACDAFQAMRNVMDRCQRLGCRRTGLVLTHRTDERVDRRWMAAYLVEQRRLPPANRVPPLLLPEWNETRLIAWLKEDRPDVVVSPWSTQLEERLRAAGWSIPEDLGLVTLDSPSAAGPVSGIFQNRPFLGSRAVDLLAGMIERNEAGVPRFPNTLLVDGLWIPGKTFHPRPREPEAVEAQTTDPQPVRAVSMREIARREGVHVSTVSLSLRGSALVASATRVRILETARQAGFRANPFVSALMKARREGRLPSERPRLAFITAFPTRAGWRKKSLVFTHYFEGARERAAAEGYQLEEIWASPKAGARGISDILKRRQIQGLLLAPLPVAGARLALAWEDFSVVGIGFTMNAARIHRVANDHYGSMTRVVRECHRLGYRRIGLALSATASARVQYRWLAAYLIQQRALRDLVPLGPLIARTWTEKTFAHWLKETRPEVVVASSPIILLRWLVSLGYSVPQDIGVASLSCPEYGGPLSGCYERADLLGARAADELIGLIKSGKKGISDHPNTLLVDGIWSRGQTVRCHSRVRGET